MPDELSGTQRASYRRVRLFTLLLTLGGILAFAPLTSAASAPWLSVERYYLNLLNCTRTGGWVRADGSCRSYGTGRFSRYVAPLRLSRGISSSVSRPYARLVARRGACSHFLNGDPGTRLRRAGYRSHRWAENLGCGAGARNPYRSVLGSHRYFQREKSYRGGHWRNMKNRRYTHVGIGVWKDNGRVRLVINFYRP